MPRTRVCDIESLITLSPHAVIFLFRFLVGACTLQVKGAEMLGNRVLWGISTYLAGLVVLDRKRTATRIAKQFGFVSHDQLWRLGKLFGDIGLAINQWWINFLLCFDLTQGWFILDDVLIQKPYAKWIIGLYNQYDHTQNRHVMGIKLVVVLWTNGKVRVPVAFAIWHAKGFVPRYRTKNQIARLLIYKLIRCGIPLNESELVCDNWYASKANLRFFERLRISIVTRLRKNAWVTLDCQRIQLKQLANLENISSYHYYRCLDAYVKSYIVEYPQVGAIRVAVVKGDRHAEPGRIKFLIATQLQLSNPQMVQRYRNRWIIELFFRDVKQHFGIADCQARESYQVIFHFRMVFLAALVIDLVTDRDSAKTPLTVEQTITNLRTLRVITVEGLPPALVEIHADGKINPFNWNTLINPVRTYLSANIDDHIPDTIYDLNIAA